VGCQRERDVSVLSAGATSQQEGAAAEALPGGATTSRGAPLERAFQQRATNSSVQNQLYFNSGVGFFIEPWLLAPSRVQTRLGLGPLYNARACADCHARGGRGQPPLSGDEPFVGLILKLGNTGRGKHGEPLPDPVYGEQLQLLAIAGVDGEGTPKLSSSERSGSYGDGAAYSLSEPAYTLQDLAYGAPGVPLGISPRVAPATLGLGLLEAIPEARLNELADPDDRDQDGISGRVNRVWDLARETMAAGRFGWKAEQPTLRQQAAAALSADIGVTSALYPRGDCTSAEPDCERAQGTVQPELVERVLDRIETYLRLVAVPERRHLDDPDVQRGQLLFQDLGCAACHVPSHTTDADAPLPELQEQNIWPYTDLLLHDLGPALADTRPSFDADPTEWRTPPLWGLGLYALVNGHQRLLHDGRARGVAEAILWHDGEAAPAQAAFRDLPGEEREALVRFVESL